MKSNLINAIAITLFESERFGGEKFPRGGCIGTLRASKVCIGIVEIKRITKEQYFECIKK